MSKPLSQEKMLQDFADAFDALPIAACRILPDRDGLIVMANTQMARLFGLDVSAKAIGHSFKDLCPDESPYEKLVDKCLELGVVRGYECTLVTKADGVCAFALTAVAHKNAIDAKVIDVLLEPVTERREIFNPLLETPFHLIQAQRIGGLWPWTIDHQTNQLLWSKGIFELLGMNPDAAGPSFEGFYQVIHPEDRERVQATFERSLRQQAPYEITYRIVRTDGALRYIKARSEATFDREGQPLRSIGVVQDVTDQELSRLAAEQESSRLNDVLEATKTATWEWNVQTGEARFNERWAEIIGYTLDELAPIDISTWLNACHPEDLARSEQALKAYFDGESDFYNVEARMRHKNGDWVWVLDRGRAVEYDDNGEPVWMYGTHQDITEKKKAEALERDTLSRLRKLTNQVPGAIYQYQQWPDGRSAIPYASGGIFDVYGIKPDEVINDAGMALASVHPDDLDKVLESITHSFHTLELWHSEHRAIPDGKTTIWVEGLAQPEKQDDGSVLWHGYIRDITARKETDARLTEASTVFRHADEGIFITDVEGTILSVNTAFTTITGFSTRQAVGKNLRILKSGRHGLSFYEDMFGALQRHGKWSGEIWNHRSDGELFAARQTISVIHDEFGKPTRYLSLLSDITELKENQDRLQSLAEKDPLTGLPNRLEISRQIDAAMTRSCQNQTSLAVAYIDLDGFKEINDRHGHSTGDRVLKIVGERLSQSFRDKDLLGRIGGDEFVAIMEHVSAGEDIQNVMRRVLGALAQEISLGHEAHQLSASIGLSWFNPGANLDGDQLIRQADQAMYQAKQAGRNCYRSFDLAQDSQVRYLNQRVAEVRRGLESGEFVLYYQPKVNMKTGAIIGAEALIRWHHPENGFLAPGQFLPELEGLDVMKALSLWVLNAAADQLTAWKKAGHTVPISVNMDGYTLL
ncbi:MAG TPA: PAS domain-containing protein, partial [Wenzhouxiangella sp.]|nr:PAS domain-containing protein [Wenzhouxiangella sp.]